MWIANTVGLLLTFNLVGFKVYERGAVSAVAVRLRKSVGYSFRCAPKRKWH